MKENIKLKEKILFGFGNGGCNVIWMMVSSFLALYYTDNVGISAAAVGSIMLVTRLFDGVSDLIMGGIIDRTHSRFGKARPWLLVSAPLLAVGLILCFSVPASLSAAGKVIWASVTYIFLAVIAYTMCNLACTTLLSYITSDQNVRTVLSSINYFISMVAVLAVSNVAMPLVQNIGWFQTAVIFGVIGMIMILLTFAGTKERTVGETQAGQKLPVMKSVKLLFQNKYFLLCTVIFLVNYIANGTVGGVAAYYAKDVLGNINTVGILITCSTIPGIVGTIFLPHLVSKIGKWQCLMGGYVIQIITYGVICLMPSNFPVVLTMVTLKGLGGLPISALMFAVAADVVDYGEYKTGVRIDGMTYSAISFGMKVGTGLGTAIMGWVLAWGEYNGALAVQSSSAVTSIIALYAGIPLVFTIVGMIAMYFTNLDKLDFRTKSNTNQE